MPNFRPPQAPLSASAQRIPMVPVAHPRLNRDLGNNELREYLAGKTESGAGLSTEGSKEKPDWLHLPKPLPPQPRILLISPPITVPRYMQRRCIPPLGLSYIASALEQAGFRVVMLDACVEGYGHTELGGGMVTYGLPLDEIRGRISRLAPDVVGTSALFSTDLEMVLRICGAAKEILPDCHTVVGGLHPTIYPRDVLELDAELHPGKPAVDWIIRGEGERRLPKLLGSLIQGRVDRHQDGLVGWDAGEAFINPQVETIACLDELPRPAYHLLPMERYFSINVPFSPVPRGRRVAQILTSRGCPIGCSFCASTNLFKRYRTHSVARVVSEIRHLQEVYQIDEVQFADDNLTLEPDRSRALMEALAPLGIAWCTPNGTMVNTLTPDLLEQMKRAGLYQLTLSVDSASRRTLKELHHKPVNLDRVPELIRRCQELGVWTHGTLVVGMPGETLEEITTAFADVLERFEFTSISTFIAQAIPGSELFHQAIENGWIRKRDAWTIDSTRCRMALGGLPAERLEAMVVDFQERFAERARKRDPEAHARKYAGLAQRGMSLEQGSWRLT